MSSSMKMPDDHTNIIHDLSDRIEQLESSHEKTVEQLTDHTDRIEKLEGDNEASKEKISCNKQDLGELKDMMPDKVDCDTFDSEIHYLKEHFSSLGDGKNVEISNIHPPKTSMSTKDTNKMKEMMAKIPELEKMLNDVLERLGRVERTTENHGKDLKDHDKSIKEIWEELAKKANATDLKDLFDRLNQLEKDLQNIVDHINSSGKSTNTATLPPVGDGNNKRLDNLEKKVEDLRNHLSNSMKDLNKTMDSLNNEVKGVNRNMDTLKNDLLKLTKKVNDLELKIEALLKKGVAQAPVVQGSSMDNEKLEDLLNALNKLREDFNDFKNHTYTNFNNVEKELDTKASKEDLEKLKNLLKGKLDELEKALNKTKSDLKRALRILSDKVNLYSTINRLLKHQRENLVLIETMPCFLKSHYKALVVPHETRT